MQPVDQLRILIVEDEPVLAGLLKRTLSRQGYGVEVFGAGAPAMDYFAGHRAGIAAAVIDLTLPDGRGELWIERMRAIAPHLPIVAMSGLPGMALPDSADVRFLAKPFRTADLVTLLDQLLRPSASASASAASAT